MENPIFRVYQNLQQFIKARNLKSLHEFKIGDNDADYLTNIMESHGYIEIKASNSDSKKLLDIVFISSQSRYSKNTPKLKELLTNVEYQEDFKSKNIDEIMLVVENDFLEEKRLMDVIDEKRSKYPNIFYRVCPYYMFVINITLKVGMPKLRIMTQEEIKSHLDEQMKEKIDLMTVDGKLDIQIVWLGGRKGDCIEYTIYSENAIMPPMVRRVV